MSLLKWALVFPVISIIAAIFGLEESRRQAPTSPASCSSSLSSSSWCYLCWA